MPQFKFMPKLLAALALIVCLAGCASSGPTIYARRDAAFSPSAKPRIALAPHRQARPEDTALGAALATELARRGFILTNSATAAYVLAYWIEESWNTMRAASGFYPGGAGRVPVGVPTYEGSPVSSPGSLSIGVSSDGRMERYLSQQSIRLELYPQEQLRAGILTAAWAGTITGGTRVKAGSEPALLRALLEHFGKDFSGRVNLDEASK